MIQRKCGRTWCKAPRHPLAGANSRDLQLRFSACCISQVSLRDEVWAMLTGQIVHATLLHTGGYVNKLTMFTLLVATTIRNR